MPVYRDTHTKDFVIVNNKYLQDNKISLKAKGLLTLCLSLPDDWRYSVNGLVALCKESRDSILSAVKELESAGYIDRRMLRDNDGRLCGSEYTIREIPEKNLPFTDNPSQENTGLQSTNKQSNNSYNRNTNYSISYKNKVLSSAGNSGTGRAYGAYNNVILSDPEFETLREEFPDNYNAWIDRLSEYMASSGKCYANHLATIRSWAKRENLKTKNGKPGKHEYEAVQRLKKRYQGV